MFLIFLIFHLAVAAHKELFYFSQEEKKEEKQPPRFQLSSLSPQERIDYSQLIEELGESPNRRPELKSASVSLCICKQELEAERSFCQQYHELIKT